MKLSGPTTIFALVAICFFIAACGEQKPAVEKTAGEKTPPAEETTAESTNAETRTMTPRQKEIRERMKILDQNKDSFSRNKTQMDEETRAKISAELQDLQDKVNWKK